MVSRLPESRLYVYHETLEPRKLCRDISELMGKNHRIIGISKKLKIENGY